MKTISLLLLIPILALTACGGNEEPAGSPAPAGDAAMKKDDTATAKGTAVSLASSEFGPMLFGPKKQAIYIFERDEQGTSSCYGDCAEAWPPVFTEGKPKAGKGVKQSLLGTTRRRDGRRQVTYNGNPLYYYAHEGPGEVRCHNVFLNGGLWWVVGPDGKRRA